MRLPRIPQGITWVVIEAVQMATVAGQLALAPQWVPGVVLTVPHFMGAVSPFPN